MKFTTEQLGLPKIQWQQLLLKKKIVDIPKDITRERRKILNRISARKSCAKKLKHKINLEMCVSHLLKEYNKVSLENQKLIVENKNLKQEIDNLKSTDQSYLNILPDILDFKI